MSRPGSRFVAARAAETGGAPGPAPGRPLEMETRRDGDRVSVELSGDLDLAARDRFLAGFAEAVDDGVLVELDLSRLTFIDSNGLRSLLDAARITEERDGSRLSLTVAEHGPVRRMIQLTLLHLKLDVRTVAGPR